MKRFINYFVVTLIIIIPVCLSAQTIPPNRGGGTGVTLDGISNLNNSIFNDIYIPMTHFNQNEMYVTVNPIYYSIETVCDVEKAKVKGDDLNGYGIGLMLSYSLTDRLFTDLSYVYTKTSGHGLVSFPAYDINYDVYKKSIKIEAQLIKLQLGFDLIDSNTWSLPVIVGGI